MVPGLTLFAIDTLWGSLSACNAVCHSGSELGAGIVRRGSNSLLSSVCRGGSAGGSSAKLHTNLAAELIESERGIDNIPDDCQETNND